MRILSAQARDGSVTAACALARELRAAPDPDFDIDAEIERLSRGAADENPADG